MERYQGDDDDIPLGGGSFVEENETGHEIYNFQPRCLKGEAQVRYYGCFYLENYKDLNLKKIGELSKNSVPTDVTVVFYAKDPRVGGKFIVGFYTNATVYSQMQEAEDLDGELINFHFVAELENCRLLPNDRRKFKVPNEGRSNIWYGGENNDTYRQLVLQFLRKCLNELPPPTAEN